MISRLDEVSNKKLCPQELKNNDDAINLKRATLLYFREVFVDSNSEHITRLLTRAANGVWVVRRGRFHPLSVVLPALHLLCPW